MWIPCRKTLFGQPIPAIHPLWRSILFKLPKENPLPRWGVWRNNGGTVWLLKARGKTVFLAGANTIRGGAFSMSCPTHVVWNLNHFCEVLQFTAYGSGEWPQCGLSGHIKQNHFEWVFRAKLVWWNCSSPTSRIGTNFTDFHSFFIATNHMYAVCGKTL